MDFKLEGILDSVRIVDEDRDYWFVRTYSGALYDYFYDNAFVALGINSIPYKYIKEASRVDEATFTRLQTIVQSTLGVPLSEATRWTNQLIDFERGVNIGDIVIMPSENSDQYAFGIVESQTFIKQTKETFEFRTEYEPIPERRKRVKWLKTIDKDDLNGDLRSLSSTRVALTNALKYREIIEGYLSSLYIREGNAYLTIQIDQEEDINAFAFNNFLTSLTYFYQEFCQENGEEYNEELYLKIKVQSKGRLALKALSILGGIGIGGLVVMSGQSELKLDLLGIVQVDGKSSGFLDAYTKFLNAKQERQIQYEKFKNSVLTP